MVVNGRAEMFPGVHELFHLHTRHREEHSFEVLPRNSFVSVLGEFASIPLLVLVKDRRQPWQGGKKKSLTYL